MAMSGQTSITTFPDGITPKPKKLGFDNYQCPFCEKIGPYHNLVPHLQGNHQRSSVQYGGYNVYKCHLRCLAKSHYHCAFCPKIVIEKKAFINHLKNCCFQQQAIAVTVPPAETRGPPVLPENTRGPTTERRGPSSETTVPPVLLEETKGPPAKTRDLPAGISGPPVETRGPPAETRGPPVEIRCPPLETTVPPLLSKQTPVETRGPPTKKRDLPVGISGPPVEIRCPLLETSGLRMEARGPLTKTRDLPVAIRGPPVETRDSPAALPAIKTNITTFPDGTKPKLEKLEFDKYQCPFCKKVGPYHSLVPHLQSHQWSSVKYGGYNVYKCYLACEARSHYHCGFCPISIIKKDRFVHHFKMCLGQQQATAVTVPPAVPVEKSGPPAETRNPPVEKMGPPAETRGPPVEKRGPSAEMRAPAAKMRRLPSDTNGQPNKILLSKCKKTTCCFCNLVMNKKNLKVHIHRHHSSKMPDISINHYLPSVCVDKKRGIFAVLMTFKDPAHYIHVQECTWGEERRITCQLDACNRLYNFARRSGQIGFACQHIQSLMFSPVPTDLPVLLDENILAEMVINKWFSKHTEKVCLGRKFAAAADGALLSYEVKLVQGGGQHFFSVFEQHNTSYSRLGRVMVHYNGLLNTWHCSCMKSRKSCPHKAIAMWHMYQVKPDIFIRSKDCHETFTAVIDPAVDTEAENITLPQRRKDMIIVDTTSFKEVFFY